MVITGDHYVWISETQPHFILDLKKNLGVGMCVCVKSRKTKRSYWKKLEKERGMGRKKVEMGTLGGRIGTSKRRAESIRKGSREVGLRKNKLQYMDKNEIMRPIHYSVK